MSLMEASRDFTEAVQAQDQHALRILLDRYTETLAEVRARIAKLPTTVAEDGLAQLYKRERLLAVESAIRAELIALSQEMGQVTATTTASTAQAGALDGVALLEAATQSTFTTPNLAAFESSVSGAQVWTPVFEELLEQGAERAIRAIQQGVLLGQNSRTIGRQVAKVFGGNAVQMGLVVRTANAYSYNKARHDTFKANAADADLEGWTWVAKLGERSCAACWAMHGTDHPLDESLQSHPGCRCSPAPKPRGTDVVIEKGADRFAQLGPEQQRAILKNDSLWRAYTEGRVTLGDMVGVRHSPVLGDFKYQRSMREIEAGWNQLNIVDIPPPPLIPKGMTARDLGVPEEYLTASGKFRPGYDARYKADLIREALNEEAAGYFDSPAHRELAKMQWTQFLDKSRAAKGLTVPVKTDLVEILKAEDELFIRNVREGRARGWSDRMIASKIGRSWDEVSAVSEEVAPRAVPKTKAKANPDIIRNANSASWARKLKTDTGDAGVPVKNIHMVTAPDGTVYKVQEGYAFRKGNLRILVEAGSDYEAQKAYREIVDSFEAALPAKQRKWINQIEVLQGRSPHDAYWAEQYKRPGFHTSATGGDGKITFWDRSGIGYRGLDQTMQHEFGHTVDTKFGLRYSGWDSAMRDDVSVNSKYQDAYINQYEGHTATLGSLRGISTYGKSSIAEDIAESVFFYVYDKQNGFLPFEVGGKRMRFAELFPYRKRFLDKHLK